ncbi:MULTISPECIES: hypothetical protein [Pseudomonas]|uniref:polysaccharide deacetylase WbmS family protein n=1 Tax=Pseudomonas TaxID=286 RepID=UPI000E1F544F|nr:MULTISPECIES: hypothetical protein [Pseudomonas]AXK53628.1 hypothetical protein DWF74_09760 [Pseudomonas protegens]MDC7817319.1 hypothetical protein [Pseudomonas sp. BLCC-B112]
MNLFSKISEISTKDDLSWSNRLFLTLDIDWANDDVINHSIDLVEEFDVPATWFITHNTPVLERLRNNPKFELGIHPNFNPLLKGDFTNGTTASEVIDRLMQLVPEATSVRSHFMTQSSYLISLFSEKGLTHECNHFIPEQANIELKPWEHWLNMTKVPYFWEDDVVCLSKNNSDLYTLKKREGLKVFDFHPIHLFLNTSDISLYNECRNFLSDTKLLSKKINRGNGSASWLKILLSQ